LLGVLTQGFFQSLRFVKATKASSANSKGSFSRYAL
jgi:hypothetical protein